MKTRILDTLHAISQTPCPPKFHSLKEAISEETNLSDEELRQKAQFILKNIIYNYASFEISTIDGFTHRILRTFAKDLGIPINFEVELNTEQILLEAVDRVVNRIGEDNELTNTLVNFTLSKTDEDKSWDISRNLVDVARLLTNENNQNELRRIKDKTLKDFSGFAKVLNSKIKKLEIEIPETATHFFEFINKHGIEPEDFKSGYLPKHFLKLLDKKYASIGFDAAWQLNIETEPLYAKKLEAHKQQILDQLQPEIAEQFFDSKKKITELEFLLEVKKQLSPLSVLNIINQEINLIKKERSLMMISEFNAIISNAIKDQPVPFIYERLGEKYSNYFIDEFQDTSQLQWENLIPLIDHSLSSLPIENETSGLTIVGDAKQSIYRWRGGKAEQFMDLYNTGNPFASGKKKIVNLPNNYRSCSEIVKFNNEFFMHVSNFMTAPEHIDLFSKTSQQTPCKEGKGYVNISFIESEKAEEDLILFPERVLEIINELEQEGVPKKDICILTRRRKEGVAIANFLSMNGIPIISSETLLVSQSPEVNFIVSLLQLSIFPNDLKQKYEILNFIASEVLQIESPHQIINQHLRSNELEISNFLNDHGIVFSLKQMKSLSLYEAVEYAINSFKLVSASDAYVQFFLDFVYEATQKSSGGILQFLELWELNTEKLSIVAPKTEDAVQIMTIHKSKGLEFPVVIYPFANNKIDDVTRNSLWISHPEDLNSIPSSYISASKKMRHWKKEAMDAYQELIYQTQLDSTNVLYVALTRPVDRLYVISNHDLNAKKEENTSKISGLLINFLKQKNLWSDAIFQYEIGEKPETKNSESTTAQTSIKQQHFYSSRPQDHGINIITTAGLLWNTAQGEAIEKGNIIHRIFEDIHIASDISNAIEKAIDEGLFPENNKDEIIEVLEEVVSHPELEEYFNGNWKTFNERETISSVGILRADRINIKDRNAVVIDYKSGEMKNVHRQQLQSYSDILEEMGYTVEKKILVYLKNTSTNSETKIVIL